MTLLKPLPEYVSEVNGGLLIYSCQYCTYFYWEHAHGFCLYSFTKFRPGKDIYLNLGYRMGKLYFVDNCVWRPINPERWTTELALMNKLYAEHYMP